MALTEEQFNKIPEKERLNSTLEGKIYWAWVSKPKISDKFKTIKYTLNLVLDEENQKKAKALGLKVNPADKYNPGPWVEIQRKVKDPDKLETSKPQVVDSVQKDVPGSLMIGNDSVGIVKFGRYWYPNNGGGVGTVLFKLQIRKLVEFKPTDKSLVTDDTGFTVAPEPTETTSSEFDK